MKIIQIISHDGFIYGLSEKGGLFKCIINEHTDEWLQMPVEYFEEEA